MKLEKIPAGTLGCDTVARVTLAQAQALHAAAYRWIARYLSLGAKQTDLSREEAADFHRAGLRIVLVQRVLRWGWLPSAKAGALYGARAARHASALGAPKGQPLFVDLEGVRQGADHAAVIAYVRAWGQAVIAAGYRCGIYVGAACGLTEAELYAIPEATAYWHGNSYGAGLPLTVGARGYQCWQGLQVEACGLQIDTNMATADERGGRLMAWAA